MEKVIIGNATLYCGDCMDLLPTLGKFDAVITDPPYGIGEKMKGGTWGAKQKYADFREWDKAPENLFFDLVERLAEKIVIWGGNYFGLRGARCYLAWHKLNAVPTMADFELAWTNLDKPCKSFSHGVGVHDTGHPTQKPLPLMKWCVLQVGKAQTILDPFLGSGTTGVAAVDMGRDFVGIEINKKYFDIACRRIEQAQQQLKLDL